MAELYLVEFKGSRKDFFYNRYYHALKESEYVVVEVDRGEDIGLVKRKIEKEMEFPEDHRPRTILRPASPEDTARMNSLRQQEKEYKHEVVEMIKVHNLPMKVVDIDYQFDGNKMTIYFTADHRVDFRQLVKDLAARYRTRIELRQIGVRDEARRIGGYGICGRPQCCSNFLTSFEPISTQQARDQNLPLNPSKISGNCGRLLCCLRYEADLYMAVKRKFPSPGTRVQAKQGTGVIERIDVFNEEAIIRDEEMLIFRSSPDDILETLSSSRAPITSLPEDRVKVDQEVANQNGSEEELRKLDDEE